MPSVYIPRTGGTFDFEPVIRMFEDEGWETADQPGCYKDLDLVDLVCFTGGSDVSPELYGEVNTHSYCDPERDVEEKKIYDYCVGQIPMVGICRGGQFLNVMNGGRLIQHIDGHSMGYQFTHMSKDSLVCDRQYLQTHGDHHQGIISVGGYVVGLGCENSRDWLEVTEDIVWYENTRCLCFQPHPEWGHEGTRRLFFDLVREYQGLA